MNKNIFRQKKDAQKGFSLIELLIVVVIFGFIFVTIARVLMTVMQSDARLTEQSESVNRNGIITDLLYTDFANPLRLMVSSEQVPNTTFPAEFVDNSAYQLSAGSAQRITQGNSDLLRSAAVLKHGNGRIRLTPAATDFEIGWHTLGANNSRNFVSIQVLESESGMRQFSITSPNGVEKTGYVNDMEQLDVRVEILSVGCRVAFFSVSSYQMILLGRSQGECPAFPLEVVATSEIGGVLANMEMSGAFTPRTAGVKHAAFPYIGTTQMISPVFINPENNDLVLFRAAGGEDKMFSLTDATYAPNTDTVVTVDAGGKGTFAANDVVFIVNYLGNGSLVGRVISTAITNDNRYMNLTIKPIYTSSNAAWGLFYSRPDDFVGKTFPAGSEVVLISPPVQYRLLSSDKLLMRREGSGLWEAVAPGVSAFSPIIDGDLLEIMLSVSTEGIETDLTFHTNRITIPIK